MVHLRLLQQQRHDKNPTLWTECKLLFGKTLERYATTTTVSTTIQPDHLQPQLWLEWGLCCHHFEFGNKGKQHFQQAQIAAGLRTILTGAMGKRTKYQQTAHAQMYLEAHSSLLASAMPDAAASTNIAGNADASTINQAVIGTVLGCTRRVYDEPAAQSHGHEPGSEQQRSGDGKNNAASNSCGDSSNNTTSATSSSTNGSSTNSGTSDSSSSDSSSSSGWQHAEWELGKRMVAEIPGARGEEAAVREVGSYRMLLARTQIRL